MGFAWKAYGQLMRPANVVTAVSDVMAGVAIASLYASQINWEWPVQTVLLVSLSTIGLYGGGVVFNDVFDAELDAVERPERPIPSGRVTKQQAIVWGSLLFAVGLLAAGLISQVSALIAGIIVVSCLVYDRWAKHHVVTGPLVMGLCRGLNLMLGMSLLQPALPETAMLCVIPIVYVAAITVISRGEVHGGKRGPLILAAFMYAAVIAVVMYFGVVKGAGWMGGVILMVFVAMIFTPLIKAIRTIQPGDIRKSVKSGVLSLIFMNAVWVAATGNLLLTLIVLLLFPLSLWLAKRFAVT